MVALAPQASGLPEGGTKSELFLPSPSSGPSLTLRRFNKDTHALVPGTCGYVTRYMAEETLQMERSLQTLKQGGYL